MSIPVKTPISLKNITDELVNKLANILRYDISEIDTEEFRFGIIQELQKMQTYTLEALSNDKIKKAFINAYETLEEIPFYYSSPPKREIGHVLTGDQFSSGDRPGDKRSQMPRDLQGFSLQEVYMSDISVNVGDEQFPLKINRAKDVSYVHPLVGTKGEVNKNGQGDLANKHGLKGIVKGVIIKHNQVAGFEFLGNDERTYFGPKKDFWLENDCQIEEDIYLNNNETMDIKKQLSHWRTQHDYMGTDWAGIEKLCFELSQATEAVHIESAGWYKYNTSRRSDMDGKDWRYITTRTKLPTTINCHSLLHDDVWTLGVTIFDTKNSIDESSLTPITDPDLWKRSALWVIKTAEVLATDGYEYKKPVEDLKHRMKLAEKYHKIKNDFISKINTLYPENSLPKYISIAINSYGIEQGRIGSYTQPSENNNQGFITIHPKATDDEAYVSDIILHELIHAASKDFYGDGHGRVFHDMAEKLGLPKEYRD